MTPNAKGSPRLGVTFSAAPANPTAPFNDPSEIADNVDPRIAHWTDAGLAIQLDDEAGILCRAEVFAWTKRDSVIVPAYLEDEEVNGSGSSLKQSPVEEVPELAENGKPEAMDVDEPESKDKDEETKPEAGVVAAAA